MCIISCQHCSIVPGAWKSFIGQAKTSALIWWKRNLSSASQTLKQHKTTIVYHDLYTDLSCCKPRHHKNHLNNTVNSNQNMAARTQVSTCFYQQQIRFDSWKYWCKICQWSVANSTIMWIVGITYHENIMGVSWTNQHWMIVLVFYTPIAHSSSDRQKSPMI